MAMWRRFFPHLNNFVLNFIYELIGNYGIAIILFSILIKLAMIPITIKQQKTMKKSAKIQAKMKEIQNKYNYYIAKMCKEKNIKFLDVASMVKNKEGLADVNLFMDDGYHLNYKGMTKTIEIIRNYD